MAGKRAEIGARGTGRLLEVWDTSPADTVDAFLGYCGTTAAAIDAGFDEAVANGLASAFKKSIAMGQSLGRSSWIVRNVTGVA